MKIKKSFNELIDELVLEKNLYKKEAYVFVISALDYYLMKRNVKRHVSGQELLNGISEFAKKEFGPMVLPVFNYWGVSETSDFGNIVYHLIEKGLFSKQTQDNLEDFDQVYEFEEEFKFEIKV